MHQPGRIVLAATLMAGGFLVLCASPASAQDKGLPPIAGTAAPAPLGANYAGNLRLCGGLTPLAFQHLVDLIDQSRARALGDVEAGGTTAAWLSAAKYNLAYLVDARSKVVALQDWLKAAKLATPYVSNATAAYNVAGYMREAAGYLQIARHHATVSAVHRKSKAARESFELTTQAIEVADALGAEGGRCYIGIYLR